jgi:transposase InsO family protein
MSALQRSLETTLVLEALHMALKQRRPRPGLVHHSDRGVQYAAKDYTDQLVQCVINDNDYAWCSSILWRTKSCARRLRSC